MSASKNEDGNNSGNPAAKKRPYTAPALTLETPDNTAAQKTTVSPVEHNNGAPFTTYFGPAS